jgi:hypothetical protein
MARPFFLIRETRNESRGARTSAIANVRARSRAPGLFGVAPNRKSFTTRCEQFSSMRRADAVGGMKTAYRKVISVGLICPACE